MERKGYEWNFQLRIPFLLYHTRFSQEHAVFCNAVRRYFSRKKCVLYIFVVMKVGRFSVLFIIT